MVRTDDLEADLTIGSISLTPAIELGEVQPLADYLANALADRGVSRVGVRIVSSMAELASLMEEGEVDVYSDSPFPVLAVDQLTPLRCRVWRWKYGERDYGSVLFARRDRGIGSVQDLTGRTVAFQERFSTSGHLLPRVTLMSRGLEMQELASVDSRPDGDKVGFIYSNDPETTLFWVLGGKTDAGALSDRLYEPMAGARTEELQIIERTPSVPRSLLCLRQGLEDALAERIEEILVGMDEDPAAAVALEGFSKTSRFEPVSPGTIAQLTELLTPVLSELEQ